MLMIFCLCSISCQKDDEDTQEITTVGTVPHNPGNNGASTYIHPDFEPFVNTFLSEMSALGENLSSKPLSVVYVDYLSAPNSSQYCAYGYPDFLNGGVALVEIIDSERCWHARSETEKENLMYHELGHALMDKGHTSGLLPNGSAKSLMCGDQCNTYNIYHRYQTEQKRYYLEELINPNIPIPAWASEKFFDRVLHVDSISENPTIWQTEIINHKSGDTPYVFFLEEEQVVSPPYALGIASTQSAESIAAGYWYRYFDVTDYDYCSNLVLKGTLTTKNLTEGFAALVIDVAENTDGEYFGRYFSLTPNNSNNTEIYIDFTAEAICLTPQTNYIRVLFYMDSHKPARVYLDNISIELYQ